MLLEILALALGMAPLLMALSAMRLYVLIVAGFIFLLADVVLFLVSRWKVMQLSGLATAGVGLALAITVIQSGETVALAYLTGFVGALLIGVGYIIVRIAGHGLGRRSA